LRQCRRQINASSTLYKSFDVIRLDSGIIIAQDLILSPESDWIITNL
jgi:hypothetical protein